MEREFARYPFSGDEGQIHIAGRLGVLSEVLSGMIIPEKASPMFAERKEAIRVKFRNNIARFDWEEFLGSSK